MSLRTPLARVRGLGSAKEGVNHWWAQRVSAVALVPLALWFVCSLVSVVHKDYAGMVAWMGYPLNTSLLVLFLSAMFYHAKLGLQVVIEDYIHCEVRKLIALLVVKFGLALLAAASIISVLRLAFGG